MQSFRVSLLHHHSTHRGPHKSQIPKLHSLSLQPPEELPCSSWPDPRKKQAMWLHRRNVQITYIHRLNLSRTFQNHQSPSKAAHEGSLLVIFRRFWYTLQTIWDHRVCVRLLRKAKIQVPCPPLCLRFRPQEFFECQRQRKMAILNCWKLTREKETQSRMR